jgi:aspartate-semialdehyde dehydrogenase
MNLHTTLLAVVGATGVVGREALAILEQRRVPAANIAALASPRSVGTTIPYAGTTLTVREATPDAFRGVGLAIFAASSGVAKDLAPHAIEAGATVIDNSSAFRLKEGVPLVVPEINAAALRTPKPPKLIANPNCSTIILLTAIEPLCRRFGLRSIHAATYQAVSGAGQAGLDALTAEIERSRGALGTSSREPAANSPFPEPCFLNVFSHNSAIEAYTGLNGEEQKIIAESQKILDRPALAVTPTCVRVPLFRAHSQAITLRLVSPASREEVLAAYADARGVRLVDDRANNRFPTPLKASGGDDILVGRLRPDPARTIDSLARADGWCLFACGDQLRKGAALNAVQIAEAL